jgi:hypothetical protein
MKSFQEHASSFVVRIWLEPREIEGASPEWRGRIEHVESGDRTYFRGLDKMVEFMVGHLDDLGGIPPFFRWKQGMREWLAQLLGGVQWVGGKRNR